jgi:ubiquinone/menaquinone biosynthesis C-methylase UbiE
MHSTDQIAQWNERSGPRWVAAQRLLDGQLEPFGRAALGRLSLGPGMRVLDVGCGCGATSFELADRVGDDPAPGAPGPFGFADAARYDSKSRTARKRASALSATEKAAHPQASFVGNAAAP